VSAKRCFIALSSFRSITKLLDVASLDSNLTVSIGIRADECSEQTASSQRLLLVVVNTELHSKVVGSPIPDDHE
jgi:hypothetical protein